MKVRFATVELLERIMEHEAGRHFWAQLGRFAKLAFARVRREIETAKGGEGGSPVGENGGLNGRVKVGGARTS